CALPICRLPAGRAGRERARRRGLSRQVRRTTQGAVMIRVDKVRAGYGDGPDILQGIDLAASGGEIVTILGPNGCGKSTLLKCIAGYVRPRGGGVHIEGRDVTRMPVHERIRHQGMGFVPQTDNVFATLTVADNIM